MKKIFNFIRGLANDETFGTALKAELAEMSAELADKI